MPSAYRVAAPSIRIVPWAALASCWPLPQQLLPVSAAGGGRRRCTLAIFSGKIIFNRTKPERLRTLRLCIFTERGRNGQLHLQRRLLRKRGAAGNFQRAELPQSKPDGFASSLREGAFGAPGRFLVAPNVLQWGERRAPSPSSLRDATLPLLSPVVTSSPGAGEVFPQRESQEHCRKLSHYA